MWWMLQVFESDPPVARLVPPPGPPLGRLYSKYIEISWHSSLACTQHEGDYADGRLICLTD